MRRTSCESGNDRCASGSGPGLPGRFLGVAGILAGLILGLAPEQSWSQSQTQAQAQEQTQAQTQTQNWQVGLSAYYSSGTYGTSSQTEVFSLPLSIRRMFDDGDVTLIIPYLSVTGDCDVTLLSGVPNKTGGTCPTRTIAGGRRTRTTVTRTTESGIGDVLLQGRYYLLDEKKFLPTIAVLARIKFPTADRDRGLGTGEFDEKLGVQLSKTLTEKWIAFADLGYTFIGSPPGVELQDQWNYDIGAGYYITPALLGSVYYEEWTAVVSGFENPRDLYFDATYTLTPAFRVNAGFLIGLSSGAPDYGLIGGLSVRF